MSTWERSDLEQLLVNAAMEILRLENEVARVERLRKENNERFADMIGRVFSPGWKIAEGLKSKAIHEAHAQRVRKGLRRKGARVYVPQAWLNRKAGAR